MILEITLIGKNHVKNKLDLIFKRLFSHYYLYSIQLKGKNLIKLPLRF